MLSQLLQEEKELSFTSFNNELAFMIGTSIIEEVKQKNLKPVRIRIVYNNDIIFQYLMDGKVGEEWLDKKQKTVELFNHSSYYVYALNEQHHQYDLLRKDYAICGGGYPIIVDDEVKGCIIVSGLAHDEDHQLIINALRRVK